MPVNDNCIIRRPNRYDLFIIFSAPRYCHILSLEGVGELPDVVCNGAVLREELDVGTIHLDVTSVPLLDVLLTAEGREAPVLGDNDLLPAGELVLRAAEGLEGDGTV